MQEEQVLQEQGIKYAQLGVRSANDIDAKYTDKALAILKEVRLKPSLGDWELHCNTSALLSVAVQMPKPVLVHCAAGLTAAMISCIRVAKENGATSSDVLVRCCRCVTHLTPFSTRVGFVRWSLSCYLTRSAGY